MRLRANAGGGLPKNKAVAPGGSWQSVTMKIRTALGSLVLVLGVLPGALPAWDYPGHRMVNQLALASLPAEFPTFVREPANAERIAFLAGEPDRWRNTEDAPLKHANSMDHYFDIEHLPEAGFDPLTIPATRQTFAAQYAAGRATNPTGYPAFDQAKNQDRTREWPVGFAPWAIAENYGKLKSAFSYLKTFEECGGTAEEIANAQANIVYVMGVMGHYVGDAAQPLHTTKHHHGWVGDNPQGYSAWYGIHSWIDGGFIAKAGISLDGLVGRVTPAQPISFATVPDGRDALFDAVVRYFLKQHEQVEPLYLLEKAGEFKPETAATNVKGRAFIEGQLLEGGKMLGAIWLTAWRAAPIDTYLRGELAKRQAAAAVQP